MTSNPERTPLLRVVKGDATPEEIAALVAVVASLPGGDQAAPRRTPEWRVHRRKMRTSYRRGPGGWRASALPQ
jgi:hypothetical protein